MRLGTIETHRPRGADAPRYASQQAAPASGSPQWVQKTFVHLFSPELLKSMRADEVVLPGAVPPGQVGTALDASIKIERRIRLPAPALFSSPSPGHLKRLVAGPCTDL